MIPSYYSYNECQREPGPPDVDNPLFRRYYAIIMSSERIQRRIERLLDEIEQEADEENWARVGRLAEQVLGFAPDNSDAQAFLDVAKERLNAASPNHLPEITPTAASEIANDDPPHVVIQPTSFANGRYQVKQFLGQGGKKQVYLPCFEYVSR